jgi:hypothetical protein
MLLDLIEKTKQTYVLLVLTNCVVVITSFDLWISKGEHEIFALVVNFLKRTLSHTKRSTIGFFETFETLGQTLAKNSQDLSEYYKSIKKISTYVKEEKVKFE